MNKPRIVFFGTPWIASQCLATLLTLDVEIVAVVCQPDREKDRKKQYIYSEVKKLALEHHLKIYQPIKVNDIFDELEQLNIDLIITCAFGQFVSERILNLPKFKCINLHASLLPQLRGGAPIHWAIINQAKQTGITIMYMVKKMDAGNIIVQQAIDITSEDTQSSLLIKLAGLAQTMLVKHIYQLSHGIVDSIEQDESQVTFGYNILAEHEFINTNADAHAVDAFIRGLYDKPIAKLKYRDQVYKIHCAKISATKSTTTPGTINRIDATGIYISTNDFDIIITKLQPPNKQVVEIKQMINGHHDFIIGSKAG